MPRLFTRSHRMPYGFMARNTVSTGSVPTQSGDMKAQERSPWSRLRYLFHGWTVLLGLSA
jgi:hypothetical protein